MSLCKWKLKHPPPCAAASGNTKVYCENEVFRSKEDMQRSIRRLCYGDLYVIGRVWIEAMRYILVGAEFRLFPTIHAAAENKPPEKPPKLKYKDLPVYSSPHFDYKDYVEKTEKCDEADVKLAHQALLPSVQAFRQAFQKSWNYFFEELSLTKKEVSTDVGTAVHDVKVFMRDKNNDPLRPATVVAGGLLGYFLTRKKYIYKRVIGTTVGTLAGGFLCYPEETDHLIRNLVFEATKAVLLLFNKFNRKNVAMREFKDCGTERTSPHVPPPPPPPNQICEERNQKKQGV